MATVTAPPPAPAPAESPRADKAPTTGGFLREMGDLVVFAGEALRALPGGLRYFSEGMRQASLMVRGTVVVLFVMQFFLGADVTNFAFFFLRSIGASDYMGLVAGYFAPREGATTMFAYVFTAKVCCGMTAELGAMKIQQEIDALESTGVDRMRYLVGTRLLGTLLFIPIGAAVALIGIFVGIYVSVVVVLQGVAPNVLLDVNWSVQTINDQLIALLTIAVIGVCTVIVACFYGLRAQGGPAEVGSSVARSLVINLVLVHVISASSAVFFYGTSLNLPIGG